MSTRSSQSRLPWLEQHALHYPEDLPITLKRDEIKASLQSHPVIIVAGATGSGKTTQLPKIALELGRGIRGRIGHTQPRRVAARSVAARIAAELQVELGHEVGYQVRFSDQVRDSSYVKLMTDGILLAELKHDRLLQRYDTLIIDEAHERSLNIDFLLGYVRRLLPKRPDLKVIITSATLDHQRFADYFHKAPIIEVSGRSFPVEIRYRPIEWQRAAEDLDINQAIYQATQELWRVDPRGDILVFLSGERAIRDATQFLKKQNLTHTELLPLFSRLSTKEQQAIFSPAAQRRIILATNIAETSLTVPGIKYVIDTGMARVKRYSYRSKIQRLPIEAIAIANADQRAGRCGRTSPGVCIRLYAEDELALRPRFTEPEILRSNLAAALLQMIDLGLGAMANFPFLDPPDGRLIRDAEKCLLELNAIDSKLQLTAIGRCLLAFPVDPRLARILIEAQHGHVLSHAVVLVAALSCQNVCERPLDKAQAADQAHQPYQDKRSDFVTVLNIWHHLQQQQRQLSNKALRDYCRSHYFSYLRFKDWQDLVIQLNTICHEQWPVARAESVWEGLDDASYAALHQAVLSGFVSQVLHKLEGKAYLGTRSRTLQLFPGSAVYKKAPEWLVCIEMVETSQLYARQVATIEPEWVAKVAAHLIKKTHGEPQFDAKRGEVFALEKVLLLGLTLIPQRRVAYAAIDPAKAHHVFVREALAQRRYESRLAFYRHNQALFDTLSDAEHRIRGHLEGLPIDALVTFFASQVPLDICDVRSFEAWYKKASLTQPDLLCLNDTWLDQVLAASHLDLYPMQWHFNDNALALSYQFAPGTPQDGVSLRVPMLLWRQLPKERLAWLVPGLLQAKISALFKHLAKAYRRSLPSDAALAWRDYWHYGEGDLYETLSAVVASQCGLVVPLEAWYEAEQALEAHLRFHIQLCDSARVIASGRDFDQLEQELTAYMADKTPQASAVVHALPPLETLPPQAVVQQEGITIPVYLAWQSTELGVVQAQFDHEAQARRAHGEGILQWLLQALQPRLQSIFKQYFKPMLQEVIVSQGLQSRTTQVKTNTESWFAHHAVYWGSEAVAWQDFCEALLTENFAEDWWLVRDRNDFDALLARHQADLGENAVILGQDWRALLERFIPLQRLLVKCRSVPQDSNTASILDDTEAQLSALLYPGCFAKTPYPWRERLAVYLQAMLLRLQKCFDHAEVQLPLQRELALLWQRWLSLDHCNPAAWEYRFMLEEYRVSLFAPGLKTLKTVSSQRLDALYQKLC